MLRNLRQYWIGRRNHARMKSMEQREQNYAILNDVSHQWLALLYYLTRAAQTRQLAEAGFEMMEVYDRDGALLAEGRDDSHSAILHYVLPSRGLRSAGERNMPLVIGPCLC